MPVEDGMEGWSGEGPFCQYNPVMWSSSEYSTVTRQPIKSLALQDTCFSTIKTHTNIIQNKRLYLFILIFKNQVCMLILTWLNLESLPILF